MKYLKRFNENQDQVDLLRTLINENPQQETHDFYIFIGRDKFIEEPKGSGKYIKSLEIERMIRITPDENSIGASKMMDLRARYQGDGSKVYHIWLPQEIREDVEGLSSESMEPWLVDTINKYKSTGSDEQGVNTYRKAKKEQDDLNQARKDGEVFGI